MMEVMDVKRKRKQYSSVEKVLYSRQHLLKMRPVSDVWAKHGWHSPVGLDWTAHGLFPVAV